MSDMAQAHPHDSILARHEARLDAVEEDVKELKSGVNRLGEKLDNHMKVLLTALGAVIAELCVHLFK